MKANICIVMLVVLPAFPLSSSFSLPDIDEPIVEDDTSMTQDTTDPAILIQKKPQTKSGGHNRLALINARFSRRPRRKHTDPEHLHELLGNYFDSQWMSVDEPTKQNAIPQIDYAVSGDSPQIEELLKHIENLNLTDEFTEDGEVELSQNSMVMIERWLLRKATCPVVYAWEDVGPMFWPRWIRKGECLNKRGICSWPPGMYCVPSRTSTLHVLRWQCRIPKGKGRRRPHKQNPKKDWKRQDVNQLHLRCHWMRVPYPITSECACTC